MQRALIVLYTSIYKAKSFFALDVWHRNSVDSWQVWWLNLSEHIELLGHREATQLFFTLFQLTIACNKIGITASSTLQCQFFRVARMWEMVNKYFNGEHHPGRRMDRYNLNWEIKITFQQWEKCLRRLHFLHYQLPVPKSNATFVL